jgi:hypothetical protein
LNIRPRALYSEGSDFWMGVFAVCRNSLRQMAGYHLEIYRYRLLLHPFTFMKRPYWETLTWVNMAWRCWPTYIDWKEIYTSGSISLLFGSFRTYITTCFIVLTMSLVKNAMNPSHRSVISFITASNCIHRIDTGATTLFQKTAFNQWQHQHNLTEEQHIDHEK